MNHCVNPTIISLLLSATDNNVLYRRCRRRHRRTENVHLVNGVVATIAGPLRRKAVEWCEVLQMVFATTLKQCRKRIEINASIPITELVPNNDVRNSS